MNDKILAKTKDPAMYHPIRSVLINLGHQEFVDVAESLYKNKKENKEDLRILCTKQEDLAIKITFLSMMTLIDSNPHFIWQVRWDEQCFDESPKFPFICEIVKIVYQKRTFKETLSEINSQIFYKIFTDCVKKLSK